MSVEAFCRLADSALAEKSAAISAEARLADREVSHDGAEVNVPPGALANSGTLSIRPLAAREVAKLDPDLINVTRGAAPSRSRASKA